VIEWIVFDEEAAVPKENTKQVFPFGTAA